MARYEPKIRRFVTIFACNILALLSACGRVGTDQAKNPFTWLLQGSGTSGKNRSGSNDGSAVATNAREPIWVTLSGSLADQFGNQAAFDGWTIAWLPADGGSSRIATVDSSGNYVLRNVSAHDATLALINPDGQFMSILAEPGERPHTVRQYFTHSRGELPRLRQFGGAIRFDDLQNVTFNASVASDIDGNGVPDGVSSSTHAFALEDASHFLLAASANIDTDQDGVPNATDPDIDGDGVPNTLDDDDNGNGILDVFDPDQNGDLAADAPLNGANPRQTQEIDWFSVAEQVASDGKISLRIAAKAHSRAGLGGISIQGPTSLFKDAALAPVNGAPTGQSSAWDGNLLDEGPTSDGGERFGATLLLAAGAAPRRDQVIFAVLNYDIGEGGVDAYPYKFPPVTTASCSILFDATTRTVLLRGNPYGAVQDFVWSATLKRGNQTLYTSEALPGTSRQIQLPESVDTSAATAEVVAATLSSIATEPPAISVATAPIAL